MTRLWLFAAVLMSLASTASQSANFDPWAVYYDYRLPPDRFFEYRLVAFDADHHPELKPLKQRGIVTLGYISLGEIESYRPGFAQARADGYILMENKAWPGSFFVDLRSRKWRQKVHERASRIVAHGFDGFMLDTLDNAAELERRDPTRFSDMTDAAATLVRELRERHPSAKIMLNRAFELHGEVAPLVDCILAESIYSEYDVSRKAYVRVPDATYQSYLDKLARVRELNPHLTIMSLDYWNPNDGATIKKIYRLQRRHGFVPYVSVRNLDRLVPEPGE